MLDAQELDILSKIQIATRGVTEKLAYKTGLLPAPAVHLVHAGQYDGYIGCRPFHRGKDARVAIARMGQLAGAFHATSMMIVWEAGDLARAIGVGDQMAEAFMFAKIDLDGRLVLTRQAFQGGLTPSMSRLENGLCRVRITWGRPVELTNVVLPGPMSGLTVQWHSSWGKAEPADVISTLEDEGYQIAFTAPG